MQAAKQPGAFQPDLIPNLHRLPVRILPQPDETTCGPTCLHAIYRYWGDEAPLDEVIGRTRRLAEGGTFAVFLACDALRRGFKATIYTYNVTMFDPTWFARPGVGAGPVPGVDIAAKLRAQRRAKAGDERLAYATEGYLEFLSLGGRLRFVDLSRYLVRGILRRGLPILTGLSSTYLYRAAREFGEDDHPDDVRGYPAGHFVVIAGYDREQRSVLVADPYQPNPFGGTHEYWLNVDRVVGAVLLGIVTHDANLLVIHPAHRPESSHPP